jgi:transcriptional regulator with XRE-family HTH domain
MQSKKKKKDILTKFGNNLKAIRRSKKLSYRKLATLCEVDHSDIKKYEDGKLDLRLVTIVDLAAGLDVHPKELLNIDFENKKEK